MSHSDASDFSSLDSLADDYVATGKSAGMSTLLWLDDRIVHKHHAGYADLASRTPITDETIYRIYSMTKPITSVALMQLFERGLFELDDAARRWIPALGDLEVHGEGALDSDITVRQLLTHTAGFSYGLVPDGHPVDALYAEVWRGGIYDRTLEQLMATLLEFPLIAQPGARWHYSIATDICGYLVELLAGMPFGDYLRQHILDPLDMTDTAFEVADNKVGRFATLYGYRDDDPLAELETGEASPFVPSRSGIPMRLHSGGGGLLSTAPDYLRFARMMLNRGELDGCRILAAETVELMTRNHLENRLLPLSYNGIAAGDYPGYGFGLGYCVTLDTARSAAAGTRGDYGWGGMADTYCWIDPEKRLTGILMQQYLPSLVHPARKDFRDAVYAALR